jgi:hypothetical protein
MAGGTTIDKRWRDHAKYERGRGEGAGRQREKDEEIN